MSDFLIANMAPIIFASMVVFLLVGFPVSFALAANGIVFGLIGIELGLLGPQLFQALPDRIFGIMNNDTLLAIPFFTFMGLILERSGMAEDLLDTIGQLFGPLRGGLAIAVIFVGALLAATTGVVAASVISMGLISLPIMLRYGYDTRVATGVIAASGTLAQIIPPSLVLIIMADQLGKSVGDMYAGAFIPGFTLTMFYVGYIALVAVFRPRWTPALPPEARTLRGGRLLMRVCTTLVPPLFLIFLVLGTIFLGIATPTEGGAMGATGALALAVGRRRLSWVLLRQAMESTAKLTTFVVFILVGARVFSLTFYGVDGHKWVEHLLIGLPGGEVGFLIVVNVLVFLLAFFLDFFELSFIVVPLLGPVAQALGIDLIWFGVLLAVNMQTSFMHPPFGFALFYLRSVAPASVKTGDIYWGAIPFVCIQILMVAILIFVPELVTIGLDKDVKVDLDSVQIDVPTSDYGASPLPPGIDEGRAAPADAEDPASKAIRESMKQDQAK
ncbi:TRAP transporter large permease subunit [Accumulibacter sp.]|uniref:TRAP transporter large permease n=1 Tax=Accumulibacter sp. TaxID=2053492 RepID=UPI0025CC9F10|nr:TRAP transporter large permease subunit [Accumulibacter sp.]MCM8596536.1 TRAP transporter large permease subunit [Accumulibacter sp.]MCM8626931.1 TRAP transporter large permease subunit [Accumulibacter sp.]MDS4050684.1 TRAP transporter large permease subunit [Accumulibacter sp.]